MSQHELKMSMTFPVQSALPTCIHHPDEEFVSYCNTCHERICEVCIRERHMTHEWKMNKKAAREIRQNTDIICEELEGMIGDSKDSNEEEKEAEIHEIEMTRVEWVSTINTIAENLKTKTITKGSHGILAEELTMLKKMLKFFQEDIKEADDNVAVEMKELFHKKKQNLSSRNKHSEKKLVFKKGTLSSDTVKYMFGEVVEETTQSEVNVTERSHFTHIDDLDHIYHILPLPNNEALIKRYQDKNIEKVDITGKVIKKRPGYSGNYIMVDNDLVFTSYGQKTIYRLTLSGTKTDLCSTAPFFSSGICRSYDGGLLVALSSCDVSEITSDSYGEVHHIDKSGRIIRKYTHTEGNSDKLCIHPDKVAQNINTDLCVVDIINKEFTSRLVVLSVTSKLRFIYTGQPALDEKLTSADVTCDCQGRILLSDYSNHAVHLLRDDGHFLQYILHVQSPLWSPVCLGLHGDILWVGCSYGMVRVYKYNDLKSHK